jgi:hypothetical protein
MSTREAVRFSRWARLSPALWLSVVCGLAAAAGRRAPPRMFPPRRGGLNCRARPSGKSDRAQFQRLAGQVERRVALPDLVTRQVCSFSFTAK